MRIRQAHDHVVVYDRDMSVRCLRCGATMRLQLPCQADVWIAAAEKFAELHAGCPPPVEATRSCGLGLDEP